MPRREHIAGCLAPSELQLQRHFSNNLLKVHHHSSLSCTNPLNVDIAVSETAMEMSVVNAGIAWAVPVRPDSLGQALETYEKNLPILNALRSCHRFRTGPKVHISRLPTEILIAIEDFVLDHAYRVRESQWVENFSHYEGRCEPYDHVQDAHNLLGDIQRDSFDELCDTCQEEDRADLCEACHLVVKANVNEHLLEHGDWCYELGSEGCWSKRQDWESTINQHPQGRFSKYDKVSLTLQVPETEKRNELGPPRQLL